MNGVIQAWAVDGQTGAVASAPTGSVAAYDTSVMAADPLGRFVHTLSGAGGAYGMGLAYSWRADATQGITYTQLLNWTDTGFSPSAGSVHPAGTRLYTSHLQGSLPPGAPVTNPFGGAYGPCTVWWYEVPAGGTLVVRGGVAADHGATSLDAEQGGRWLLVACQTQTANDGNVTVISLDAAGDPTAVVHRAGGLGLPVAVASAP